MFCEFDSECGLTEVTDIDVLEQLLKLYTEYGNSNSDI